MMKQEVNENYEKRKHSDNVFEGGGSINPYFLDSYQAATLAGYTESKIDIYMYPCECFLLPLYPLKYGIFPLVSGLHYPVKDTYANRPSSLNSRRQCRSWLLSHSEANGTLYKGSKREK